MRLLQDKDIWIHDNWVNVNGLGRIGMYCPSSKAILLDYSMKWIVGSNEEIPSTGDHTDIKEKIKILFNGI